MENGLLFLKALDQEKEILAKLLKLMEKEKDFADEREEADGRIREELLNELESVLSRKEEWQEALAKDLEKLPDDLRLSLQKAAVEILEQNQKISELENQRSQRFEVFLREQKREIKKFRERRTVFAGYQENPIEEESALMDEKK